MYSAVERCYLCIYKTETSGRKEKKKADVTAISVVASGPFCMVVGLIVARYWSDGNSFAVVLGMIAGFVFGVFMRKLFVAK